MTNRVGSSHVEQSMTGGLCSLRGVAEPMRRRQFLWATGTVAAGSAGLAGCMGDVETIPGDEYPAIDEWLTETEVGDADDTYDGAIIDQRGTDEVQVDVGVKGNGGDYAFGPSAVAVTPGTTVRWVWTGEGGGHSVVADPASQIGESDYEFSSGELVSEAGHEYTQTLDEAGVALYHCDGITGISGAVAGGSDYELAAVSGGDPGRPFGRSLEAADGTALHFDPHLQLGMKGAVAVAE